MRLKVIFLFVLLLPLPGQSSLSAFCPPWTKVWPTGDTLYENSIFIVEYGGWEGMKENWDKDSFYLISFHYDTIRLVKQEFLQNRGRSQTIFRPEKKLEAGKGYELYIESRQNNVSKPVAYPYKVYDSKYGQVTKWWLVKEGEDTKPAIWKTLPTLKCQTGHIYPTRGVSGLSLFECAVSDNSEYMVRVNIKGITTDTVISYIIPVHDSVIAVGYRSCGINIIGFDLIDRHLYEIEFDIIDACGNITPWILRQQYSNNPYAAILPFTPRRASPMRDDVLRFVAPVFRDYNCYYR